MDREDRLLAGLTARQLVVLASGTGVLVLAWSVVGAVVPGIVFAVGAAPIAAVTLVLTFGQLAGLSGDRAALSWLRYLRSNKRLVLAPEGIPALPEWLPKVEQPSPLSLPVTGVDEAGVIDLGPDGAALICRATSLNFGLRTTDEQVRAVTAFGRWLNSLNVPVQIVVRAERVDLADNVSELRGRLSALPHPALEAAAEEHASFLIELSQRHDVFRRVVLIVFRVPERDDAVTVLQRLAEDAAASLASAGIGVRPLAGPEAASVIAQRPRSGSALLPDELLMGWSN